MKTINGTPLQFLRWLDAARAHALVEVDVRHGGVTMVNISDGVIFSAEDAEALKTAAVPSVDYDGTFKAVTSHAPAMHMDPATTLLSTIVPDSAVTALNNAVSTAVKNVEMLLDKSASPHYNLTVG